MLGVERDLKKGVQYLNSAILLERPRAKYIMALLYGCGAGVKQDSNKAWQLCKEASDSGVLDATSKLKKLENKTKG